MPPHINPMPGMDEPGLGETNLGALIGAIVGSIGGLLAIGGTRAIIAGNLTMFFGTPILAMISWAVGGIVGWFIGGQLGPRLGRKFSSQRAEIIGGILGGLI